MATKYNFENNPGYNKLKEAFSRSNRDFLDSIELAPAEDVYFSPQYEKKMDRLIKRQKRPYWKFTNTVGKRIAVIALAFLMLFGLSMTMGAVRAPVISFIENVFEKFSELFVNKSEIKNAPRRIEEVYTLNNVPEGYYDFAQSINDYYVETRWSYENYSIVFTQNTISGKVSTDIEDVDSITFIQNNMEIHFLCKNKTTYAVWNNNRYIFEIVFEDEISVEFMQELIKSINLIK